MLEMKKVTSISIRELQQNLKQVMGRVAHGQVFEVTRHRQKIEDLREAGAYIDRRFSIPR